MLPVRLLTRKNYVQGDSRARLCQEPVQSIRKESGIQSQEGRSCLPSLTIRPNLVMCVRIMLSHEGIQVIRGFFQTNFVNILVSLGQEYIIISILEIKISFFYEFQTTNVTKLSKNL